MANGALSALPDGVRLGVSPLSWANDVLEDLGADIPLETCLGDAAAVGYQGVELGRKFPRDAATLGPLLKDMRLALASGWHSGFLAEKFGRGGNGQPSRACGLLKALGAVGHGLWRMRDDGAGLAARRADVASRHAEVATVAAYAARLPNSVAA